MSARSGAPVEVGTRAMPAMPATTARLLARLAAPVRVEAVAAWPTWAPTWARPPKGQS